MSTPVNRRDFVRDALTAGAAMAAASAAAGPATANAGSVSGAPASVPAASANANVAWPMWDAVEEKALNGVLNSGAWWRGSGARVKEFEALFAERTKSKYCLAVSSGTTALITSLGALGIGPGDEVIIPPYTFVATFNAVTQSYALPVFVDSDLETFQIDAAKVSAAVTPATRVLLPVHIGGSPADLDTLVAVGKEKNLPVIEDACQAPLAEWKGQPVGPIGLGGCISFQASKNLNAGEGGVVLTNDETFYNQCYNFHTPGGGKAAPSSGRGSNFRMTEWQAAILLSQYSRMEEQCKRRDENAAYLTKLLSEIPGIMPARLTSGCTRSAWHLYMMRYDSAQFGNLPRAQFLQKLNAAGVGASSGYSPLNKMGHVRALAGNPHYQRIYGKAAMKQWLERIECPVNDRLCEQAVWLTQTALLGTKSDTEQIADAFRAVRKQAVGSA